MRRTNRRLLEAVVVSLAQSEVARPPRRSADIYTITPADLSEADEVVQRCESEWKQAGGVCVTDNQLDQALESARRVRDEFNQAKWESRRSLTWVYLSAVRLFVLTRLPGLGKPAVLGIAAAVVCGLSLLSSPFLFGSCGAAFEGATILTVCGCLLAVVAVLTLWPTEAKRQAFQRLHRHRKEHRERAEALGPAADQAWADYKLLQQHWALCSRLEKARRRREELIALLASAKYQLIHMDWRSLRGPDFERFLSRVFEMLGYHVQLTKASADQGVDLVVTGKGKKVAVQTKGYADSVGNHAVMEVVAGMAYYQCDSCAVVTNSHFTSTAQRLAWANGCCLIDGAHIPDLIEGRIY